MIAGDSLPTRPEYKRSYIQAIPWVIPRFKQMKLNKIGLKILTTIAARCHKLKNMSNRK